MKGNNSYTRTQWRQKMVHSVHTTYYIVYHQPEQQESEQVTVNTIIMMNLGGQFGSIAAMHVDVTFVAVAPCGTV